MSEKMNRIRRCIKKMEKMKVSLYSLEARAFRRRGSKKMEKKERLPSPSILEYVLRVKKEEVANCETISQATGFEVEMNAWMDELDGKRKEEEEEDE